jgi:hypothetical protein
MNNPPKGVKPNCVFGNTNNWRFIEVKTIKKPTSSNSLIASQTKVKKSFLIMVVVIGSLL